MERKRQMAKRCLLHFTILILCLMNLNAQSQIIVEGKVIDKETKDPLPAYISVKGTDVGNSADYDGTFKLVLSSSDIEHPLVLEVFQLGYKRKEVKARAGEKILIELELEPLPPHEVVVTADSLVSEEKTRKTVTLKKMDIYTLPGTAADPVYASQILPGINSLPDSSNMLIRGGSPDEVAYYFDGIEIEHPFLSGSLHEAYFSIFDNQIIEGFNVSTSGFHTKFGDALSGVMNIAAKDNLSKGEGGIGLSIMGLNSYIGMPIKNVGSFLGCYNRGHSALMTKINNREESEFETEHAFALEDSYSEESGITGTRLGLYMSDKFRLADRFYLTLGGRLSTLSIHNADASIDPRLSLAYFITGKDILRFSAGCHHQYGDYFYHQAHDLKAKRASHLSLTYDRISENLDLRVSLYNKEYQNLFLFEENLISNSGHGYARGAEFFIKWKKSQYDALFVYNFLSSKRKENDVLVLTTSPYEINHSFTGIFTYKFHDSSLGIRFSYATGLPFTPLDGREWDDAEKAFVPIWGDPYGQRYPFYQRLDINGSKNFTFQKHLIVLYFGITNVLNRKNILRYEYSSDYSVRSNNYSIFGRSIFVGIYIPFF